MPRVWLATATALRRSSSGSRAAFEAERQRWKELRIDEVPDDTGVSAGADAEDIPDGSTGAFSEVPGNVWKILVDEGAVVAAGDALAIIESMKMEISIKAPVAGRLLSIRIKPGQTLRAGDVVAVVQNYEELIAATTSPVRNVCPGLMRIEYPTGNGSLYADFHLHQLDDRERRRRPPHCAFGDQNFPDIPGASENTPVLPCRDIFGMQPRFSHCRPQIIEVCADLSSVDVRPRRRLCCRCLNAHSVVAVTSDPWHSRRRKIRSSDLEWVSPCGNASRGPPTTPRALTGKKRISSKNRRSHGSTPLNTGMVRHVFHTLDGSGRTIR